MLDNLLEALGFVGNVLDTPAAMVRNAAAKRNPVSAIYDWQGRASGRDILTAWGAPENDPDRWELNDFLGAGLDLGIGALTPGLPIGLAARKMGLLGGSARGASMIDDAAAKLPGMASDHSWVMHGDIQPWSPAESMPQIGSKIVGLLPAPAAPFYSRLDRAIETLPDKPIKAESLVNMLKKAPGGVSNEEIRWMFPEQELLDGSPVVTKDQVRSWSQDMGLMPKTETLLDKATRTVGDDGGRFPDDAIQAMYTHYVADHPDAVGRKFAYDSPHDYKETLFKLPDNFTIDYREPHWKDIGNRVFAHTRSSTRDLYGVSDSAEPLRGVKFLDEYQSQWHQTGRKNGYKDGGVADLWDTRKVPDGPFKDDWKDIALKHTLYDAAASGSPGIAWSRGDQIADLVGGPPEAMMKFYDEETPSRLSKLLKMHGEDSPTHIKSGSSSPPSVKLSDIGGGDIRAKWDGIPVSGVNQMTIQGYADGPDLNLHSYRIVSGGEVVADGFLSRAGALSHIQDLVKKANSSGSASRYFNYMPISPEVRARILAEGFPLLSALGLGAGAIGLTQAGNAGDNPR